MTISGGIFDFDTKAERLIEVTRELEDPAVWNNPENAQKLGQERSSLERIVKTLSSHSEVLDDAKDLLELAVEENDEDTFNAVQNDLDELEKGLEGGFQLAVLAVADGQPPASAAHVTSPPTQSFMPLPSEPATQLAQLSAISPNIRVCGA